MNSYFIFFFMHSREFFYLLRSLLSLLYRPNGSLVAVFGDFDISEDSEPKKSVTIRVKKIIYHPEFNTRTFDNDLALLKLQRPVQYDTHIGKNDLNVEIIK